MKNNITCQVSIVIEASTNKVWEALTKPELIKKYFFGTEAVSDWKEGAPLIFKGEWQGKKYEDKGTILEVKTGKLLRYSYWSSMSGIEDKPENYVIVTYKLEEGNSSHTILTIKQENIPNDDMRKHSEQNWNKVLNDLKHLLEDGVAAYF